MSLTGLANIGGTGGITGGAYTRVLLIDDGGDESYH